MRSTREWACGTVRSWARYRTMVLWLVGLTVLGMAGAVRGQLARRGGEFQINTVTEGDQHAARIAALPDGGFLVAWESETNVAARRFDANGQPLGPEFPVNLKTVGGAPSVAAAPDGSSLVTWRSGNDIVGQRFDTTGARQGEEFTLTEPPNELGVEPSVTAVGDAQFVVVWEDPTNYLVRGRMVTPSAQGPSFAIMDGLDLQYVGGVASDAAGSYQVVWYDADLPQMRGQVFDSGQPTSTSSPFTIDSVNSQNTGDPGPNICGYSNDGYLVVWADYETDFDHPVKYRQYGSSGLALGPALRVTPDEEVGDACEFTPDVACGPDGTYLIVWFDDHKLPVNRGRLFQGTGFSDFAIGIVEPGFFAEPLKPAVLKDGDAVVVWSDCTLGNACEVIGQQFTSSGPTDCPGDCNRDGHVTVDELLLAVNIALDSPDAPLMKQCLPADVNLDYRVTVDELVRAVNRALDGCS